MQATTQAVVPRTIINRFIIRAVEAETSRAVAVGNLLEGVAANPSQLQRRRSRIADNADDAGSAENGER